MKFADGRMTEAKHRGPLEVLVERFPKWLSYFESNGPFRRSDQLQYHRETVDRRLELGSAAAAVTDERFQRSL